MLNIQTHDMRNASIIRIEGEVDLYSSPQLRKILIEKIDQATPVLLVDLKDVPYMDSSGVATLVEGLQRLREYDGKLGICNLQGAVREVFELSRLDKVFLIFEDEAEALRGLHVRH